MIPTPAQLALLRTRPQSTKLWLSVYKPSTVLACRVATSHGVGEMVINYDTVTSGSYSSVEYGMTLYIGTSAGKFDLGKLRVKSATPTTITVAENADVDWTIGQYLTVVKYWEINAVYPRIIQDPGDLENTIWYKDYDIPYTFQNDVPGSFICMGSHFAGFLENGSCSVYYSASGTYSIASGTYSYDWWFDGASTTGSSAYTPGYITYTQPGHYTTRFRVIHSSGTYDESFRHISIYDRPEQGTNTPILNWNLLSLSGSRDSGGYNGRIWIRESTDDIVDGALVVIFADDYYGSTKQSIGGNSLNRDKIVFVGYILDGSISFSYKDSSVEFGIGSATEIMKITEGFAIGVNSSANPSAEPASNPDVPSSWTVVKDMTVKSAIYHYLKWHSTVLMTNDFEFSGTDQNIQFFDADRESLYSAISTLMQGALVGEVVADRQSKLWAEVSVSVMNSGSSVLPTTMSLDKQDWMGNVGIEESTAKQVSFLEMGGIYFPGPGNDSTPYMASSPGSVPSYRGSMERVQGLALSSQAQLNSLVGNLYAWKNARYPNVSLNLAGNFRNMDIAPQELIKLTVLPEDNNRQVTWNEKAFQITGLGYDYRAEKETLLSTLDLHEIVQGFDATTIVVPPVPENTGYNIPGLKVPSFPISPIKIIYSGGGGANKFIPAQQAYDDNNGVEWYVHKRIGSVDRYLVGFYSPAWGESPYGNTTITINGTCYTPSAGNYKFTPVVWSYDSMTAYFEFNAIRGVCGSSSLSGNTAINASTSIVTGWNCLVSLAQTIACNANDIVFLSMYRSSASTSPNNSMSLVGWVMESV